MKNIIYFLLLISSTVKSQNIYTYVGNGNTGFSGDGGYCGNATANSMFGIAFDKAGNLYFADAFNHRIRKVNASGIISTIAGNGGPAANGDGGLATAAEIGMPIDIAIDTSGNIYFSDQGYNKVRKINTSGIISTIAGTGTNGYTGDGGQATLAQMSGPEGVAVDDSGYVFISDRGNNCIRKINSNGIINTVIGTGVYGFSGDGGQASLAQLNSPYGIALDSAHNLYITDLGNTRIRKVDAQGIITTIAGTGTAGSLGDGGPATSAQLKWPQGVCVDRLGNVYVSDFFNSTVRKINTAGTITRVAGNGTPGFSGDGGLATLAQMYQVRKVAVDDFGNIYASDYQNNRIRVVCATNCLAGIENHSLNRADYILFPNPNNGSFNIKFNSDMNATEIIIFDVIGQTVFRQKLTKPENNIITQGLCKGLYSYSILKDNIQISNGKLAVE